MSQRLLSLRSVRSGSLLDLFDVGLSFRLMLDLGFLPPLKTMNDFLACGRDDTDDKEGLAEWEPFSLTATEYRRLAKNLRDRGRDVEIEDGTTRPASTTYQQWFATHLADRSAKPLMGVKSPKTKQK